MTMSAISHDRGGTIDVVAPAAKRLKAAYLKHGIVYRLSRFETAQIVAIGSSLCNTTKLLMRHCRRPSPRMPNANRPSPRSSPLLRPACGALGGTWKPSRGFKARSVDPRDRDRV